MDIAKIRKKLKETEPGEKQPKADSKAQEQQQVPAGKADETISDSPAEHKPEQVEYQADSRDLSAGPGSAPSERTDVLSESGESPEPEQVAAAAETESASGKKPQAQTGEDDETTEVKEEENRTEEIIEILTFRLFKEEFALKVSQLKEILKYQRITKVPKMPDYVVGITSLRGKVIPVIDLRAKVSSQAQLPDITRRIKILIIKGPKGLIGAVVDRVVGVVRIARSEILPPPSHLTEEQLKFIDGIAIIDKRFVSILNMEESISMQFN